MPVKVKKPESCCDLTWLVYLVVFKLYNLMSAVKSLVKKN